MQAMEKSTKGVTKATGHIQNLNNVLQAIVESIQKVRDEITQIATAVEEQSAASEQVTANIERSSNISKDMETMSDDVLREVSGLVKTAEALRNSSAGFKTRGGELMILDMAKTDHRVFVGKVGACLKGDSSLDPSKLPDHHNCRFGKWYDTEGRERCGTLQSYRALNAPHERIHSIARDAVAACNSGNKEKATKIYREMEDLSEQIVSLLDGIKRECG